MKTVSVYLIATRVLQLCLIKHLVSNSNTWSTGVCGLWHFGECHMECRYICVCHTVWHIRSTQAIVAWMLQTPNSKRNTCHTHLTCTRIWHACI